jgi:hypothetical protein
MKPVDPRYWLAVKLEQDIWDAYDTRDEVAQVWIESDGSRPWGWVL